VNTWMKAAIVAFLATAVGAVVMARRSPIRTADQSANPKASAASDQTCCSVGAGAARTSSATTQPASAAMPRLLDLGANQCIPCKKMAPILEELKTEMVGRLQVEFIDVWINPDAGQVYGINLIPTQIFYDAAGKELSRHEGFMPKEDILGRFKAHGIDLAKAQ